MRRARWLLNLDQHSIEDLFETLVESAPDGYLSRPAFLRGGSFRHVGVCVLPRRVVRSKNDERGV